MDDTPTFGYWIRRRRKALDLTQEELARRAGCSLGAIRKLEGDERRPSRELAESLARVLEVPPEEHAAFLKVARAELAADHLRRPSLGASHLGQAMAREPVPRTGLLADDAPLQAPPPQRRNLPVPPTPLIGREREITAITMLIQDPAVRLLTLTGTGGTGKTRLASAAAEAVAPAFTHGVWAVELASLSDPLLVIPTIAQALGVRVTSGQPIQESLHAAVCERQMLLVLDNFEQILPAAPHITALLAAVPGLKVLVTSRAVLHLRGEHEYPVPPLALPDQQQFPALDALSQYAAVALFIQRARAIRPGFQVDTANASALVAICARLDGLPLAIELAAMRSRLFGLEALLARLDHRLPWLAGRASDLPQRQQTLRNTIAWSYDLLDAAHQRLFRRLAVFVGAWTLEAAEGVCTAYGDLGVDVVEGLTTLVEQSLLQQPPEDIRVQDGEPRFRMLETLREYALEQLVASGEAALLYRRHAGYYLRLVEAAEPALRGAQQVAWGARLEREHDNLQASLRWFIAQGAAEQGLRMGGALWRFWGFCGHATEGCDLLRKLLALPGGGTGRAKAQLGLGWLSYIQLDWYHAIMHFEESVVLYREVGDDWGLAFALGSRAYWLSRPLRERYCAQSVALFDELRDPWGIAFAFAVRGAIAAAHRDPVAHALAGEGIGRLRKLGDRWFLALMLTQLGEAAREVEDSEWEDWLLEESLALAREMNDEVAIANATHVLALSARWHGDYAKAATLYDESVVLFRELAMKVGVTSALHGRGMVAYHEGDDWQAQALFEKCLSYFAEAQHMDGVAWCFEGLAGVAGRAGAAGARRAARLLGAGEVLAHSPYSTWNGLGGAEYAGIAEAVRVQLDEAEWDAAWAEGQGMTMEQAIAYALEVSNPGSSAS